MQLGTSRKLNMEPRNTRLFERNIIFQTISFEFKTLIFGNYISTGSEVCPTIGRTLRRYLDTKRRVEGIIATTNGPWCGGCWALQPSLWQMPGSISRTLILAMISIVVNIKSPYCSINAILVLLTLLILLTLFSLLTVMSVNANASLDLL